MLGDFQFVLGAASTCKQTNKAPIALAKCHDWYYRNREASYGFQIGSGPEWEHNLCVVSVAESHLYSREARRSILLRSEEAVENGRTKDG